MWPFDRWSFDIVPHRYLGDTVIEFNACSLWNGWDVKAKKEITWSETKGTKMASRSEQAFDIFKESHSFRFRLVVLNYHLKIISERAVTLEQK